MDQRVSHRVPRVWAPAGDPCAVHGSWVSTVVAMPVGMAEAAPPNGSNHSAGLLTSVRAPTRVLRLSRSRIPAPSGCVVGWTTRSLPSAGGLSPTRTWIEYVASMLGQQRSLGLALRWSGSFATSIGGCGGTHAKPDPAAASCVWAAPARHYMPDDRYECSWTELDPGPQPSTTSPSIRSLARPGAASGLRVLDRGVRESLRVASELEIVAPASSATVHCSTIRLRSRTS